MGFWWPGKNRLVDREVAGAMACCGSIEKSARGLAQPAHRSRARERGASRREEGPSPIKHLFMDPCCRMTTRSRAGDLSVGVSGHKDCAWAGQDTTGIQARPVT